MYFQKNNKNIYYFGYICFSLILIIIIIKKEIKIINFNKKLSFGLLLIHLTVL